MTLLHQVQPAVGLGFAPVFSPGDYLTDTGVAFTADGTTITYAGIVVYRFGTLNSFDICPRGGNVIGLVEWPWEGGGVKLASRPFPTGTAVFEWIMQNVTATETIAHAKVTPDGFIYAQTGSGEIYVAPAEVNADGVLLTADGVGSLSRAGSSVFLNRGGQDYGGRSVASETVDIDETDCETYPGTIDRKQTNRTVTDHAATPAAGFLFRGGAKIADLIAPDLGFYRPAGNAASSMGFDVRTGGSAGETFGLIGVIGSESRDETYGGFLSGNIYVTNDLIGIVDTDTDGWHAMTGGPSGFADAGRVFGSRSVQTATAHVTETHCGMSLREWVDGDPVVTALGTLTDADIADIEWVCPMGSALLLQARGDFGGGRRLFKIHGGSVSGPHALPDGVNRMRPAIYLPAAGVVYAGDTSDKQMYASLDGLSWVPVTFDVKDLEISTITAF